MRAFAAIFFAAAVACLATVLVLTVDGGSTHSEAVAVVGDAEYSREEFRSDYVGHLAATGLQDDIRYRLAFLNRQIGMRLLVREARDAGIADAPGYSEREQRVRRKLMIEGYLKNFVFDTLAVEPREVAAMYTRMSTQLEASHLYAKSRDEADELYERLAAGESFEELAREVFTDPRLAHSGGHLGQFGFDEMDPAFEDAAFALAPGSISPPVRTAHGYSIIRLEDRFTKPVVSESEFAQKKDRVERYVRHRKMQQYRTALSGQILQECTFELDRNALEAFRAHLYGQSLVSEEAPTEAVIRCGDRIWSRREIEIEFRLVREALRKEGASFEGFEQLLSGLVVRLELLRRAASRAVEELPEFDRAIEREMDKWVYEEAWARRRDLVTIT
jgi:hypothetical protein